jgi:hypothetical protein
VVAAFAGSANSEVVASATADTIAISGFLNEVMVISPYYLFC